MMDTGIQRFIAIKLIFTFLTYFYEKNNQILSFCSYSWDIIRMSLWAIRMRYASIGAKNKSLRAR